jgi:hypothetical protein
VRDGRHAHRRGGDAPHVGAERGKEVVAHLYGQEINAETYAIAKADLLLKGEGEAADNIVGGPEHSTLSNDAFPSHEFDFMLSNPPYGKSWKSDLERMGGKKGMRDPRFVIEHAGDPEYSLLTRTSDGQMLFLANMLSKMKHNTPLGSRVAEVHNGSSLFTGDAGQGESNIRRWIIENDWLEAIVALPLNMFYNTGIATYIWVLSNRKPEHRRGKVQLIDATKWFRPCGRTWARRTASSPTRTSRGSATPSSPSRRRTESRIFPNAAFGYWKVTVERPLRIKGIDPERAYTAKEVRSSRTTGEVSEDAPPVIRKIHKGKKVTADPLRGLFEVTIEGKQRVVEYESDTDLRDTEQVPLLEEGGVEAFLRREVLPYAPDAWYEPDKVKTGYEISFTRYFYKPEPLRTLEEIRADILALERETEGLLEEALIEIRDPLFRALLRAETAVLDDLPKKFNLPEGSLQRQDILPLPRKVLREAIVNALMHRDYRVHGPTQIIRFADRIEIHNPGYSLKPPTQLGKPGSANRNPTIASVLHDTDLAETKGTGIGTMRRLMESAELAPPTFESERGENRFIAHIPLTHFLSKEDLAWLSGIGEELSAHERIVLVHVRDDGTVNNEAVRKMTGLDSLSASSLLRRLCSPAVDLLTKEGAGTATYYRPTARFVASLPDDVSVPGIDEPQPEMGDLEIQVVPGKSSKQAAKSSMSRRKSSMSGGKSPMLPAELEKMLTEIGGKADDAVMRDAILRLCRWRPLSSHEIADFLGRTADYLKTRYLKPMVAEGALAHTIPDKPRSRYQKYTTPDEER